MFLKQFYMDPWINTVDIYMVNVKSDQFYG